MANEPKKICLGPKALFFLSSHGTHLETYSYYENVPMVPNATILQLYSQILVSGQMQLYCILCNYMQLYCNLCNYMQLYATICNYMQLYMQLYATILQQFRMQLYATMQHALCSFPKNLYATICKYENRT
jgi:hypothetical protein